MWRNNAAGAREFHRRIRAVASWRDGAEARADVAAVRREKVAIAVADHPSSRRPRAAAQNLAGAEPGRGIVFVDVGREARKWIEGACCPFPDVADHLPAAPGAVAFGAGADIDAAERNAVEIGPRRAGRGLAPGIGALAAAERAIGRRLGRR